MSQANIPNISPVTSIKTDQTVTLLLASIALEELALAHVINAEAEKLQFALGKLKPTKTKLSPKKLSASNLFAINASAERILQDVIKKEMLLQFKLENVLDLMDMKPQP
ncbi:MULTISPECIES: hypothetical protein [Neobacillus]|uniref:Uncharacterized protein n=1 Tax=Neobacillus rhizophilus TaxID=2833579 RepID=A0A942U5I4_9BACI|nr:MULTISPECIES: hypothetical protein [Neobacillus]MBS4213247.1 hypothetical protein [Neobacillus rhizophilus]MBU8914643.1 hypothetical protein [Bacillus sp. FJAT-29953]